MARQHDRPRQVGTHAGRDELRRGGHARRFERAVQVQHLAEADAGDEAGGCGDGHPAAHMRVTGHDRAGGLREGDDAGRPLERFEATRDVRLLDGETIGRQRGVGLRLELGTDVGDPAIELVEADPAAFTGAQMRMDLAGRPETGELVLVEMSAPDAIKK